MSIKNQIGGNHYFGLIPQPSEIWDLWKLSPHEASILKYLSRYKYKNGKEDLEKALSFALDLPAGESMASSLIRGFFAKRKVTPEAVCHYWSIKALDAASIHALYRYTAHRSGKNRTLLINAIKLMVADL